MPFTFAHPAIVLPFKNATNRFISFTALVAGSMTPDFEYFIRFRDFGMYGHTIAGLFWFDLPLGLMLFYVYQHLVKDALIDHLPYFLKVRVTPWKGINSASTPVARFLVVSISILLGSATHIFWDSFTHRYGYFVTVIPPLGKMIYLGHQHYQKVYNLLQHCSTIIGCILILISLMRLPKIIDVPRKPIVAYWLVMAAGVVITLMIKFRMGLTLHQYGEVVVSAISGGLIGLLLASLLFKGKKVRPAVVTPKVTG
jgi:hypothetical protein